MSFQEVILLLGVMVAPIPPLLIAAAWLHGSLSRLNTKLEVSIANQNTSNARVERLEDRIERLERHIAGEQA